MRPLIPKDTIPTLIFETDIRVVLF
jgi:hypothetical protein